VWFLCRPRDLSQECDFQQDRGPVIRFGGVTGRWTGSLHSNKNAVGIEARVNFETYAGERTMSFLEIGNGGTTALYFNWKVLIILVYTLQKYCSVPMLFCAKCMLWYLMSNFLVVLIHHKVLVKYSSVVLVLVDNIWYILCYNHMYCRKSWKRTRSECQTAEFKDSTSTKAMVCYTV